MIRWNWRISCEPRISIQWSLVFDERENVEAKGSWEPNTRANKKRIGQCAQWCGSLDCPSILFAVRHTRQNREVRTAIGTISLFISLRSGRTSSFSVAGLFSYSALGGIGSGFVFVFFLLGGGAISEIAERISSVFVSAPGTWSGAARWEPSAGSRPIAPTPRHWRRRPATPGRRRRRVSVAPRPALEFRPSGRVQSDTLDVWPRWLRQRYVSVDVSPKRWVDSTSIFGLEDV